MPYAAGAGRLRRAPKIKKTENVRETRAGNGTWMRAERCRNLKIMHTKHRAGNWGLCSKHRAGNWGFTCKALRRKSFWV